METYTPGMSDLFIVKIMITTIKVTILFVLTKKKDKFIISDDTLLDDGCSS